MDAAFFEGLRERLALIERAEHHLADNPWHLSVQSGQRISDERLDAEPVAELTAEEGVSSQSGPACLSDVVEECEAASASRRASEIALRQTAHSKRSDEGSRLLIELHTYRLSPVDDYADDAGIANFGHGNPRLDVRFRSNLIRGLADNTLCVPRKILAWGLAPE